jgi:hypothetical protein
VQLSKPDAGFYEQIVGLRIRADAVDVTIARIENSGRIAQIVGYRVVEIRDLVVRAVSGLHIWKEIGRVGDSLVCLRHEPVATIAYFPRAECP